MDRKKKRRSGGNVVLLILLFLLLAVCAGAIFYLGRNFLQKEAAQAEEAMFAQEIQNPAKEAEQVSEAEETPAIPTPTSTSKPTPLPEKMMAGDVALHSGYTASASEETVVPADTDVLSANSVLIDLSTDTIVVAKDAAIRISPASMTKILTVLVAAEQIENLDGTFTVTSEMTAYCLNNGCSAAGFVGGETVPVRDLFYGTILPSGGEAAVALATCAAGSHEAFVELMNQKLAELGLSDTAHFTNCVGIYDENHYCTLMDMAMILKAAIQNDWAREVLSTKVHTTALTEQNPEGIVLSNWFLRRIEDKDSGGTVIAAKTGFVNEAGVCAASYAVSAEGNPYICVTAHANTNWQCIYDHVALYKLYAK